MMQSEKRTVSEVLDLEQAQKEYSDRRAELMRVRERWGSEMRFFSDFIRQRDLDREASESRHARE